MHSHESQRLSSLIHVEPMTWILWGVTLRHDDAVHCDLAPAELVQASEITSQWRRAELFTGSQLARDVVHMALGTARNSIWIDRTCSECESPHGRPVVRLLDEANPRNQCGDLSISHSAGWTVAAFTLHGRIGVDIEDPSRADRIEFIRERVLHPDELCSGQLHDRDALIRAWVRKESILKASGEGIRLPMSGICLVDQELTKWDAHPEIVMKVHLRDLEAPPGLIGAVALIPSNPLGC